MIINIKEMKKTIYILTALTALAVTSCGQGGKAEEEKVIGASKREAIEAYAKDEHIAVYEEVIDIEGIGEDGISYDESKDVPGYEIAFITDSHIALCDQRDAGIMDIANARYSMIRDDNPDITPEVVSLNCMDDPGSEVASPGDQSFIALMDLADIIQPDLLLLGGDTIDQAAYASIDFVASRLDNTDYPYVYTIGNHDFEYGSEYYTKKAYSEYLPRLSRLSKSVSGCQLYDMGDIYILSVDDDNNKVSKSATDTLKDIYDDKKPVIVVSHLPFEPENGEELIQDTIKLWGDNGSGGSKVILGDDGCVPDENTREFMELMTDEKSPVVLVLAGHIHAYHRDMLNDRIVQITGEGGFLRSMVYLKII